MKSLYSIIAIVIIAMAYYSLAEKKQVDNVKKYFENKTSDVQVKTFGRVIKLLPDDNDGNKHQKFIIKTNDITVLIAHNIDIAPRIPLKKGDYVWVYGEYEWNQKGGIIHWTHKDKKGIHPNGFIKHKKKTYQ